VTRSRIPCASARQLVRSPRRLALDGGRWSTDVRHASRPRGGKACNRDYGPSAYCVLTPGESVMFQRDAAGLPVRVRPSGGREFGSLQWSEHAIWSAADATRVGRKYDGQSAAARPPRIPSLAAVTGVALPSRFQQPRLAFVRVYPYARRPRILNIASIDAEYLLPTATVANQQFPSLYSMRHECYQYW
jgi:hypothetical protein